jgi:hypothetical protein
MSRRFPVIAANNHLQSQNSKIAQDYFNDHTCEGTRP